MQQKLSSMRLEAARSAAQEAAHLVVLQRAVIKAHRCSSLLCLPAQQTVGNGRPAVCSSL